MMSAVHRARFPLLLVAATVLLGVRASASSSTTADVDAARSIAACIPGAIDLTSSVLFVPADGARRGADRASAVRESIAALDAASLSAYRRFVFDTFCVSGPTAPRAAKSLVIHATGDLHRRLLAYSSARSLAQAAGRTLLLLWRADAECEAPFDALFTPRPGELVLSHWSDSMFPDALYAEYRELARRVDSDHRVAGAAGDPQRCAGQTDAGVRRYAFAPRRLPTSPDDGAARAATVVGRIDEEHEHLFVRASAALVTSAADDDSSPARRARLAAGLRDLEPAPPVRAALAAMLDGADNGERDLIGLFLELDDGAHAGGQGALECRRGDVATTARAMRAACAARVRSRSAALRTPPSCTFLLFNGDGRDAHKAKTHALSAILGVAGALRSAAAGAKMVAPELATIELRSQVAACRERPSAALACVRDQAARLFAMGHTAELLVLPACSSAVSDVVLALHDGASRQRAVQHPSDRCGWLATPSTPVSAPTLLPPRGPAAISLVVACRGRHGALEANLPSWLSVRGVGELVVVDWSSSPPLRGALDRALGQAARERLRAEAAEPQPPRVLLARVEDEATWVLSRAYNVGFRLAEGELVLKLDCDVRVQAAFVDAHARALLHGAVDDLERAVLPPRRAAEPAASLRRQAFVAGDWRRARSADELSLNGLLLAWRSALRAIGGYDERIATYGWDDSDLYARLERTGERRLPLARDAATNLTLARHASHTSEARLVHSDVSARASATDETAERRGRLSLARVVGASSAAELELSAGERAVLAIQQNRIALDALPDAWGQPCDAAMTTSSADAVAEDVGTTSSAAADGACLVDRRARFDAWCGSRYEWLHTECAAASTNDQGAVDRAGGKLLSQVVLRATSRTPTLHERLGEAAFLAAWYEALAQELRGFRSARRRAQPKHP